MFVNKEAKVNSLINSPFIVKFKIRQNFWDFQMIQPTYTFYLNLSKEESFFRI